MPARHRKRGGERDRVVKHELNVRPQNGAYDYSVQSGASSVTSPLIGLCLGLLPLVFIDMTREGLQLSGILIVFFLADLLGPHTMFHDIRWNQDMHDACAIGGTVTMLLPLFQHFDEFRCHGTPEQLYVLSGLLALMAFIDASYLMYFWAFIRILWVDEIAYDPYVNWWPVPQIVVIILINMCHYDATRERGVAPRKQYFTAADAMYLEFTKLPVALLSFIPLILESNRIIFCYTVSIIIMIILSTGEKLRHLLSLHIMSTIACYFKGSMVALLVPLFFEFDGVCLSGISNIALLPIYQVLTLFVCLIVMIVDGNLTWMSGVVYRVCLCAFTVFAVYVNGGFDISQVPILDLAYEALMFFAHIVTLLNYEI